MYLVVCWYGVPLACAFLTRHTSAHSTMMLHQYEQLFSHSVKPKHKCVSAYLAEKGGEVSLAESTPTSLLVGYPMPLQIDMDGRIFAKSTQIEKYVVRTTGNQVFGNAKSLAFFNMKCFQLGESLERSNFLAIAHCMSKACKPSSSRK